jgi:hypothetical protein
MPGFFLPEGKLSLARIFDAFKWRVQDANARASGRSAFFD